VTMCMMVDAYIIAPGQRNSALLSALFATPGPHFLGTMVKIACIGAGYVGGPTMAVIALFCPDIEVVVCDLNQARIDAWNSDDLPIFEPGLDDVVKEARGRNLFFSTDTEKHVKEADIIFVRYFPPSCTRALQRHGLALIPHVSSVNTPTKTTGIGAGKAADLSYWESAARMIAKACTGKGFKVIVEKSTVPVKTAQAISKVRLLHADMSP
jgi:UDPglucose 6-dehydrogenase